MVLVQNLNTEDGDLLKNLIENIEQINQNAVSTEEMAVYVAENSAPGGGSIANINDLNNILKDTPIRDLSTYDTLNTNQFLQPLTTIPHNSPPDNIPFFSYWSYKIDICTSDGFDNFTDFANHQTHDFGRSRGTTANIAIANPEIIGVRNFRVYYEMDSYPITGSPYRTEYKQGSFEITPELIG